MIKFLMHREFHDDRGVDRRTAGMERSFTDMQDVRSARAMVRPKAPASPARIHDPHPISYHHPGDTRQSVEEHEGLQRPGHRDTSAVAHVPHDPHDHGESEES